MDQINRPGTRGLQSNHKRGYGEFSNGSAFSARTAAFRRKFWLYVITEAATDTPQLNAIQNPAAHFRMDEDIFATGFMIPEENWRGKAESAS